MKLLFVSTRWPLPITTGDRLRNYYLLKELAKANIDVTFVAPYSRPEEIHLMNQAGLPVDARAIYFSPFLNRLKAIMGIPGKEPIQLKIFHIAKLKKAIYKMMDSGNYGAILTSMVRAAQYVEDISELPKYVDLIDPLSQTYNRILNNTDGRSGSIMSKIYRIESDRMVKYELKILENFDHSYLVSEKDIEYFRRFIDVGTLHVSPNGVNLDYFKFNEIEPQSGKISFHGNIHYFPNSDAVVYFCDEILPMIRRYMPNALFTVVGNSPKRSIRRYLEQQNVHCTGRVQDIRAHLKNSWVSVCPMRVGSGIQNKILESMAMGIPVVTTSLGLEGIDAVHGTHLLIADTPKEFAFAVLSILTDVDLRETLRQNARKLVEQKYAWHQALKPIIKTIKEHFEITMPAERTATIAEKR